MSYSRPSLFLRRVLIVDAAASAVTGLQMLARRWPARRAGWEFRRRCCARPASISIPYVAFASATW